MQPNRFTGRLWGKLILLLASTVSIVSAQMGVTINTSNPTPTAGGAAFSYTIVATNHATGPVFMQLNDALPPGILFQNLGTSGAAANCQGPPVGKNGAVTCENPTFPAGGVLTLTVVCTTSPDLTGGVRTNTVNVIPSTNPSFPGTASVAQTLQNDANITSFLKTSTSTVKRGGIIDYNIAVTNAGQSSAVNVVVTDTLPSFTGFESVVGSRDFEDACAFRPNQTLVCSAKFLRTGTSEITISMRASNENRMPSTLVNTVSIAAAVGTISAGSPTTASTSVVR